MGQTRSSSKQEMSCGRRLRRAAALRGIRLGEIISILLLFDEGTVDRLLKDRLTVNHLELGAKLFSVVGDGATVGAATGIGKSKVLVGNVFMKGAPVALASTVLLDLFGIDVGVATLGKVTGKMLNGESSAFGDALVITVVGLVGASHDGGWFQRDVSV